MARTKRYLDVETGIERTTEKSNDARYMVFFGALLAIAVIVGIIYNLAA